MQDSVSRWRVDNSDSGLLSELIDLDSSAPRVWNADELGAVLRHQLSAPVRIDLCQLDRGTAAQLATVAEAQNLLLKSFNDLLHHPTPPLAMLEMVKEFAKANLNHPDSPLPHEVANVVYYASIVAARIGCGRRISTLDDERLRHGIEMILANSWLDDATRSLMRGLAEMKGAHRRNDSGDMPISVKGVRSVAMYKGHAL